MIFESIELLPREVAGDIDDPEDAVDMVMSAVPDDDIMTENIVAVVDAVSKSFVTVLESAPTEVDAPRVRGRDLERVGEVSDMSDVVEVVLMLLFVADSLPTDVKTSRVRERVLDREDDDNEVENAGRSLVGNVESTVDEVLMTDVDTKVNRLFD